MAQIQTSNPDILPKSFVTAMRTLFRIMDDQNTGFVKYSDIEERWQDDGTQGLPKGVLESLKKVTPPNGLLTFERFCAGLKICLLQIQNGADSKQREGQPNRPPSAPILADAQNKPAWTSPNTAAIRPNNAISQQRTLSMPQLLGGRKDSSGVPIEVAETRNTADSKVVKTFGPPKPPRTGAATEGRALSSDRNFDKSEIRTVLQNWQMGLMMSEDKRQAASANYPTDSRTLLRPTRALGDGKSVDLQSNQNGLPPKKTMGRRREPRRHTLQNGIDYNMVKDVRNFGSQLGCNQEYRNCSLTEAVRIGIFWMNYQTLCFLMEKACF